MYIKYSFSNGKGDIKIKREANESFKIINDGKINVYPKLKEALAPYGEFLDGNYDQPIIILSKELTKVEQAEVLNIFQNFDVEAAKTELENEKIIAQRQQEYKEIIDGLTLEAIRLGVETPEAKALIEQANAKVKEIKEKLPKKEL